MSQDNKSPQITKIYNLPTIFFSLFIILQLLVGVYIIFCPSPDQIIISYGQENLFPNLNKEQSKYLPEYSEYKNKKPLAIQNIKNDSWQQAKTNLELALFDSVETECSDKKKMINDPEALIYLNNAKIKVANPNEKKTYTIAVAVPISKQPNESLEILRGVAQAQNEFNCFSSKNSNKDFSLKVSITEDNDNKDYAKEVAKALAKEPNILGVVGHYSSDVTLAARDIYNDKELVAITPVSTAVNLSENTKSKNYVFRTVPSDNLAANALAKYMLKTLKKTKAAVLYNDKITYGKSLKEEFEKSLPGNQKKDKEYDEFNLSNPSFSPVNSMKQAIKEGAEVLMLVPHDEDTINKALLLIYQNKKKLNILGGDVVFNPNIFQKDSEWLDLINEMVVAIPWHIEANRDSDFVKKSEKLWGGDVSWRTALAYDATKALIEAIKKDPTRSGVRKALLSNSIDGASGKVQFEEDGDRKGTSVQLVKIVCVDQRNQRNQSKCNIRFQPIPIPKN